jgi:hypothetical protein
MKLTKLSAAPWFVWRRRLMPVPAGMDAGTTSQLIRGVVSSERRNIPAMIRAACSGRLGWSVNGRVTPGG